MVVWTGQGSFFVGKKFPHYCVFLNGGVPYDGSGSGDVYHNDGDHDEETFEMLEKDFSFYIHSPVPVFSAP